MLLHLNQNYALKIVNDFIGFFLSLCYETNPEVHLSKNVIGYLSNIKKIIVNIHGFLKIAAHLKSENVNLVNPFVIYTLILTPGTPNSNRP
jgi:hypothetical protein